jgi:hypothetical protein
MSTWQGGTGNFSVAANWSGSLLPSLTESAVFDGAVSNANCNINVTSQCFNFTIQNGYNGTITFTNQLNVRGNITLLTSVNFAGSAGIGLNSATAVFHTSNGKQFDRPLLTAGTGSNGFTISFVDNWRVTNFSIPFIGNNSYIFGGAGIVEITGNVDVRQQMTASTATFRITGAATIITANNGLLGGTFLFNSGVNTITIGTTSGSVVSLTDGTFRYVDGNIVNNGTISIARAGSVVVFDLLDITFNNLTTIGNSSITLQSNANFNNVTLGDGNGTGVGLNGVGQRLNVRGNFRVGQVSGGLLGTGIICLKGSGTLSASNPALASTSSTIGVDLEVNTSGTYTATSNISLGGTSKYFTRTNGLINWATFTLIVNSSRTFTTAGITFNNVTMSTSVTTTITNLFTIAGTLSLGAGGTIVFTGTAGWTCGTLTCSTPNTVIVLQSGITYTTTVNVDMLGTNAQKITMRSNAPTVSYAIWTLQNPATQSMVYVSATAIDSSLGMTIYSFGGIISTAPPVPTLNWALGAYQGTKAFTFVS